MSPRLLLLLADLSEGALEIRQTAQTQLMDKSSEGLVGLQVCVWWLQLPGTWLLAPFQSDHPRSTTVFILLFIVISKAGAGLAHHGAVFCSTLLYVQATKGASNRSSRSSANLAVAGIVMIAG